MNTLFSKDEVNTGRQTAVDMAKMFAIFFMVIIHTFESGEADTETGLGYFFDSIAGAQFGAPVFMFCMGIGLTFSRKSDPRNMAQRGLMLVLAGYLLNVVRALPMFLLVPATRDTSYLAEAYNALTDVDILQFAGVAFLLFALCKQLKIGFHWMAALAVMLSVSGSFVRKMDFHSFWLDVMFSPFVGVDTEFVRTDFPLLNWFVFVVAGYGFGMWLRRCNDCDKLYLRLLPITAVIYGAYAAYAIPHEIGMFGTCPQDFYHMNSIDMLICLDAALLAISLCHFIAKILTENLMHSVTRVCNDLTKIYIAQWIIIMWCVRAFMTEYMGWELPIGWQLVVGIVILLLSIGWARIKPLSKLKL